MTIRTRETIVYVAWGLLLVLLIMSLVMAVASTSLIGTYSNSTGTLHFGFDDTCVVSSHNTSHTYNTAIDSQQSFVSLRDRDTDAEYISYRYRVSGIITHRTLYLYVNEADKIMDQPVEVFKER